MIHGTGFNRGFLNHEMMLHRRKTSTLRGAPSTMLIWLRADIQRTL
jgi:hypothetical protein